MIAKSPVTGMRAALGAALLAVALAAGGCGHDDASGARAPATHAETTPTRDLATAERFELWMAPRLDAAVTLLDAGRLGLDWIAQALRAREPGTGIAAPETEPMAVVLRSAQDAARRRLADARPFDTEDREQSGLARDTDAQLAAMAVALEDLAASLPDLGMRAAGLGPLGAADARVLSAGLGRVMALHLHADNVFADFVIGLLTDATDPLPERDLQILRRRANAILLLSLEQFAGDGLRGAAAAARAEAIGAALATQRRGLAGAGRKLDQLHAAALSLRPPQRAMMESVLASYAAGFDAEESFHDAVARFAPLAFAIDHDDPDATPRLVAALHDAARLGGRVRARLQANLARLRSLATLGGEKT